MKKSLLYYIIVFTIFIIASCEEAIHKPISFSNQTPQPVLNPIVVNKPGGAIIKYDLPNDPDILYVKAEYELPGGIKMESRSSLFNDSIEVEGYGDTDKHSVLLYTVNRGGKVSEFVQVFIQPETPSVHYVKETLTLLPDFGGIRLNWMNKDNAALAFFVLMSNPNTKEFELIETIYSAMTEGNYTIRGFENEEKEFAVVLRDRWDNYSDTIKVVTTPMFEEKLDKKKFIPIVLPGDTDMNGWSGRYPYVYDDNPNTYNHSEAGTGWPQHFTLDLGVVAQLSRVNILQRQNQPFKHGNPRILEIWGMTEEPPADGSWDGWVKLRDAVAIKPSLQGGTSDEDNLHLKNGDEYDIPIEMPPVRYIRILVHETWGLTGFIHIAEATFYGQVIN